MDRKHINEVKIQILFYSISLLSFIGNITKLIPLLIDSIINWMIFDFSTPINTDIYILLRIFTPKRYVRSLRVRRLHQSFSIKLHKGDPIHINKKAQNFQHQMVGPETEDNRVE